MQTFHFKARDARGSTVKGNIDADNLMDAKRRLADRDLILLHVGAGGGGVDWLNKLSTSFAQLTQPITLEEIIVFNRQLQTSYSVGISMVQALRMIADQCGNPRFKRILEEIIEEVSQGRSLNESMARYPDVFDSIYVNAVKAGEASGKLEDIFNMLCYFAEQKMENDAKLKSATLYPKIILFTIFMVLTVVTTFVIPKLKEFFGKFGGQLPPVTVFVMGISDFVLSYWYLLIAAAVLGRWLFVRYTSTVKGRLQWHALQLKMPVFGVILLQSDLLTFATVLRILLQAGLPIIEAFEVVRDSLKNQVVKNEIENCRASVEMGRNVAYGFNQSKVFPKMIGNLISVGEESGKIDEVLDKVRQYYKLQLEYKLANLSKAIEPVFLFLIFGIVLVLVLAVFMPIWKMSQLLRPH